MSELQLFSLMVSPFHPDFSSTYADMNIRQHVFTSERKAIKALKTVKPDLVIADFIYGYGNNYAGVNLCNLDVFLYSLQKEAPGARLVVFAEKPELEYVDRLGSLFRIDGVFSYPVDPGSFRSCLGSLDTDNP